MLFISSCNNSPKSPSDSEQPNTLKSSVINTITSPIIGVDFSKAKSPYANGELPKEQLVKIDAGHLIVFSKTPVGLKHCFEELKSIINDNNKSFNTPDVNDVLLASYVDGIEDYESLDLSLQSGSSEVTKGWNLPNGWNIGLVLNKDVYSIMFVPPKKE
jgi:hypothetical protein